MTSSAMRAGAPPVNVVVVVPTPDRDLDGTALVAFHLRRYGITAVCCGSNDVERECLRNAPAVLVLDMLGSSPRQREARLAKGVGAKVAIMCTAGLGSYDQAGTLGSDLELRRCVDRFLVWGESAQHAYESSEGVAVDRVRTTGVPRFDFYHSRYSALMGTREDFAEDCGLADGRAPIVLWTTSTPEAKGSWNAKIAGRVAFANVSEELLRSSIEAEHRALEEHSDLIARLARQHPEWQFLVKVHPRESLQHYTQLAANIPNMRVARGGAIRRFLYHSDVLLQCCSTTASEAWMMDKPVVQLPGDSWYESLPDAYRTGNTAIADFGELDAAVTSAIRGGSLTEVQQEARRAFIADRYFAADGCAADRCAAEIATLVREITHDQGRHARVIDGWAAARDRHSAAADARLVNRVKDRFGVGRETSLRFWKRFGRRRVEREITAAVIEHLYGEFESALSNESDVQSLFSDLAQNSVE